MIIVFRKKETLEWQVLSNNVINNVLLLAVYMTRAPRWNTHALVATLGPIYIKQNISLCVSGPNASADSWSIVAFKVPKKNVARLTSIELRNKKGRYNLELESGKYMLGLRYYGLRNNACLPDISIDGKVIKGKSVQVDSNGFYEILKNKQSIFYFFMHYHIYVLLKYDKFFPVSFINREYLPVGDPSNKFLFGIVNKGDSIVLSATVDLLEYYNVYYTLYSCSSFPKDWFSIDVNKIKTNPVEENGYYLIRCRPKTSCQKYTEGSLSVARI